MRVLLPIISALAVVTAVSAAVVEDRDRFGNVDGRGPLTASAARLGLSDKMVTQLRAATGYIVCPGSEHRNGIVASAALVESAQLLVTVGHAFIDEQGRPRDPVGDCVFRNQAVPPSEIRLAGGDWLWVGLTGAARPHDPNDYAVALLSQPVPDARPLRFGSVAAPGNRVIGLVAWQEIEGVDLDPDVPVAQDCAIRDLDAANGATPTNYLTDCDLGPVGSGGQILSLASGEVATLGIFSTSGGELSVGRSFNRHLGSYTRAIGTDAGLAAAVERALSALRSR